ncbi:relaxase/mobilization nuclease domain-containing protein [Campylobacter jejuni]|uniref:relaxase/mobilization nuclease domain-containing protein n=1 Tax=Campylobacter jejuni TaxID=197 RepID=UPI0027FC53DF|nr:relaxase/mobilization nuclease domain-containing protein [Campylobacter jejuni]EIU8168735.1 relaxase/mobilization nuclease domain-containing protein [Campylobacter coli]EIU4569220.1 relaxase/mobilization nuclease domain-containing protein [Campylobacter jejuni]EIU8169801.1 relaxase/mobilization nuclease domain-containing protein [Campylobacter coli]EJC3584567.1 relaxase/mobilization nuclease domain-containing protein [Campylobacter jejuni]
MLKFKVSTLNSISCTLTPEQAHKNAVELAEHTKAWKGHEVLIATHIDKGHIHTHFIVNSVNYENGHKLQWM